MAECRNEKNGRKNKRMIQRCLILLLLIHLECSFSLTALARFLRWNPLFTAKFLPPIADPAPLISLLCSNIQPSQARQS
jgi:hypothetical protein